MEEWPAWRCAGARSTWDVSPRSGHRRLRTADEPQLADHGARGDADGPRASVVTGCPTESPSPYGLETRVRSRHELLTGVFTQEA